MLHSNKTLEGFIRGGTYLQKWFLWWGLFWGGFIWRWGLFEELRYTTREVKIWFNHQTMHTSEGPWWTTSLKECIPSPLLILGDRRGSITLAAPVWKVSLATVTRNAINIQYMQACLTELCLTGSRDGHLLVFSTNYNNVFRIRFNYENDKHCWLNSTRNHEE